MAYSSHKGKLKLGEKLHQIKPAPEMCTFGDVVMRFARLREIRTQAALARSLNAAGYGIRERTLTNYLYGRVVVDPALPVYLASILRLNKKERRELADAYTFGQPGRAYNPTKQAG